MYLLGIDLGSSSVKVALFDTLTHCPVSISQYPESEMQINAPERGWAEQDPELWWSYTKQAIKNLISESDIDPFLIKAIGISYQMHGLVLVDKSQEVMRPAIIWCDDRAVDIGRKAKEDLGSDFCNTHFLNSPANFTASKMKWVLDNEPEIGSAIYKMMLPGNFIAMKMTGQILSTVSGMSECVMWDFENKKIGNALLDYFGINKDWIPEVQSTFDTHGRVSLMVARELGLPPNIPISYMAGDQPNNAMSLGVLSPGEAAATGGTSGVVYAVTDHLVSDASGRVNAFAHVNHSDDQNRIGVLLCINGCGIQYAWLRKQMSSEGTPYQDIERMIKDVPPGSEGLRILPFGNGAERMLENASPGAQINNLQFNRHTQAHVYRAAIEGIAFSFIYGIELLRELGTQISTIKVGNDNLFQSDVFAQTISNLSACDIQIIDTRGAIGTAKAAGVGIGVYSTVEEAFNNQKIISVIKPESGNSDLDTAYEMWKADLQKLLAK